MMKKCKKFLGIFLCVGLMTVLMVAALLAYGKKAAIMDANSTLEEIAMEEPMTDTEMQPELVAQEVISEKVEDTEDSLEVETTENTEEIETDTEVGEPMINQEELVAEATEQMLAESMSQTAPEQSQIIICIDPGHGGENEGTKREYDGSMIVEKELNSKIAASLRTYLEQYQGVQVVVTRESDVDISLVDRVNFAVANNADYLISVHINNRSREDIDPSGCMVLTSCSRYQPSNAKVSSLYDSETTLAKSIISSLNGIGIKIADDWETEYTEGILRRVSTSGRTYPDGSTGDYYGLIHHGTCAGVPTIIVEHAFLSNESDYRNYLSSNEQLDALAKADAQGIANALSLK